MAGIYLHIPFCRSACAYCNFHFSTSLKFKNELLNAMHKELILRIDYLNAEKVDSIYFGGGTPSILNVEEIESFLNHIRSLTDVAHHAEITLEANPEDLAISYLTGLKSIGINRLSIGVQSFFAEDLQTLGRKHSEGQAYQCIEMVKNTGFDNYSIDLIYGIPNSNYWSENLNLICKIGIPHFSAYALTLEPKTIYHWQVKNKKATMPNDNELNLQYMELCQFAKKNSFEHYEISNFCKSGYQAVHNSNYWNGSKYLGIGPSAHSYNQISRQWNTIVNSDYINKINHDELYFELEKLSEKDLLNEYIMTSLRTSRGIELSKLKALTSEKHFNFIKNQIIKLESDGLLISNNNHFRLSEKGMFYSDGIISNLFEI